MNSRTMVSTRLAPLALVLLLLAVVPTVLHTYAGSLFDDGVRVGEVSAALNGMSSTPSDRKPNWGERRFGSDEWLERWYEAGHRLRLTVVRTYDSKAVYHHPELAISYPEALLGPATLERLPGGEPMFVLRGMDQSRDLVAYALIADGRIIENPYVEQMRLALRMLMGGRRPMTLVYVQDGNPPPVVLAQQPAVQLLARALARLVAPASSGAGSTP